MTTNHWKLPEDVRSPVTAEEAQAALDMIDAQMDRIESVIASRGGSAGLKSLLMSWTVKRAEVAYAMERLDAGDPPPSIELATARAKIAVLEGHIEKLREKVHMDVHAPSTRAAELAAEAEALKKKNADLSKKNAGLAQAIEGLHAGIAKAKGDTRYLAAVRGYHKQCASILEVFDDLEGRGVVLPPMARLVRNSARTGLPAGYLATTWAIDGRPHLINAAREIEAREVSP